MKNSTRIALAVTAVWFGLTLWAFAVGHFRDDEIGFALIIVLPVIWALKFILGAFVDKKGEK
jgi:MFS-type transporter involved in bile tolerance (Atg22 family)